MLLEKLNQGLEQMNINLSNQIKESLIDYLILLDKWNKIYNLTGVKEIEKMVSVHLLDSLSAMPYIFGDMILDVGTGAGLPGIPLALCYPDKSFYLLDSNKKKTRFLNQVKIELQINNLYIESSRLENYQQNQCFHTIISRAFGSVKTIEPCVKYLCQNCGNIVMMKGSYEKLSKEEIPSSLMQYNIEKISIPGIFEEKHIVILKKHQH